ncbi:MAG: hypothetical protein KC492_45155, partial [Myxococcales bacterium]|nr:hypothetical protein [Myxococcales bacterium]
MLGRHQPLLSTRLEDATYFVCRLTEARKRLGGAPGRVGVPLRLVDAEERHQVIGPRGITTNSAPDGIGVLTCIRDAA